VTETAHTSGFGRRLVAFALFALCMFTALAVTSSAKAVIESPPPPQVWSDKADYAPGETVTLSGSNWAAGESVHIRVNDDAGETWRRDVDVVAGDDGTISDQFNLPDWFVAQYTVTATGATSGTATWTFTDGNVSLHPGPTADGVTQYRVTYDLWNGTSTTCGGAAHTSPSPSSSNLTLTVTSPNNTNIPGFGGSTSSALLKSVTVLAPATGKTFDFWTSGDNKDDSGTVVPSPACVTNNNNAGSGNLTDLYAHFRNANTAPVCNNGSASTPEDMAVAANLNCTDADGNTLSYTIVSGPTNGVLSGTGASRTYTPNGNFNGTDSFTFKANDGTLDSNVATFTVTVTEVNDPPDAVDDSASVAEDSATGVLVDVLANDSKGPANEGGQSLTITAVGTPAHGSAVVESGKIRYTPTQANYNGSDSFTYTIRDNGTTNGVNDFKSDTATVSITVTAVNDAPTCSDDSATTAEDTAKALTLSCADIDSGSLTYSIVSGPAHGSLSGTGANRTYTPDANYNGSDSFTFKASDGSLDSNVATFSLTITAVNDDPTVARDNASVSVNESQTATNTGTFGDVDGDTVTLSASVGTVVEHLGGTWSWSFTTSDGPDDSQTVTISANDGNGGTASTTFSLTVNNVAPTVSFSASNDTSVNEGTDEHTYAFSVTDPGQDNFTVDAYDCGTYGNLVASSLTTSGSGGSFKCVFPDGPASSNVHVKVSDSDGASDTDSEAVQVVAIANVAPSVTAAADQSSNEGESHSFSLGSFSDPGPDADWSVDVNWGDGSAHTSFTASATGSLGSQSHTYADGPNDYTVTVTVTDHEDNPADQLSGSATFAVHVNNVAPSVTAAANQSSNEGGSHSFNLGSFTDPGPDGPWSVDVDWGDGSAHATFTAASPGSLGTQSHTYADGPNDYTFTVKVSEAGSGTTPSGQATFSVHVNNVAPSASFANTGPVDEGTSFGLSLLSPTDPSSGDAAAGFQYRFDCGDGLGYGPWSTSNTATCATDDNGARSVKGQIKDRDGDASEYTASVTVKNVAPSATFSNNGPVNEGSSFTIQLTSPIDPSSADTSAGFQYAFDCGNGAGYGAYGAASSRSCPTTDNGTRTVKGKIKDKDGGEREYTGSVTVNNVKPTITNVTATNTYSGPLVFMTSMIKTFFTDPGADANWAAALNFSDGGTDAGSGNASPITINHPFLTPGCKTVTARVTDKDGAVSDPFGPTSINVGTGEFLPPVTNTRVTNKLKNGQVLPVKIRLTDCNGVAVTNLAPAIILKEGDYTTGVADDGVAAIAVDSVSGADTNGIMRSVDGSYIYNMRVNVQKLNTDYTIIIYPFGLADTTQSIRHVIQATK
jgi:hypothetical protein